MAVFLCFVSCLIVSDIAEKCAAYPQREQKNRVKNNRERRVNIVTCGYICAQVKRNCLRIV